MTSWRSATIESLRQEPIGAGFTLVQFASSAKPFRDTPRWDGRELDVSMALGDLTIQDVWRMMSGHPCLPPGARLRRFTSDSLLRAGYGLHATPTRHFPAHVSVTGPHGFTDSIECKRWWANAVPLTELCSDGMMDA